MFHSDDGLKEVPYEIRLKRLNLWTLEDRRVHDDLIEAVSYTHLTLPTNREV